MSELEELKAISAEVHSRMEGGGDSLIMWDEVVKHFDRAIAIAEANDEGWQQASRLIQDCGESRKTMEKERDEARAAVAHACGYPDCEKRYVHIWNIGVAFCEEHHEKMMPTIVTKEDWEGTVAAVLALRDAIKSTSPWHHVLADTQSYEQYR